MQTKTIVDTIREKEEEDGEKQESRLDHKELFLLAIATSIDALAVGVTFVGKATFGGVLAHNIFFCVGVIGVTTFILSAIGVKIGNIFGVKYKCKAELAGGIVLVLMGLKMFIQHFI